MINKIKEILNNELPDSFNITVEDCHSIFNDKQIRIMFSPNTYKINQLSGQHPQIVSLLLNLEDLDLHPQIFVGNGGRRIYREIDPLHPREKYLAMVGIDIPFRRPKNTEEAVLRAIKRFAQNYIRTLKENKDVLRYKDVVDYSFLD